MLKKFVLTALVAASSITTFPTAAAADSPWDPCYLHAGCFWETDHWVCSDPGIYAMCKTPDGVTAGDALTFEPIKD